MPQAYYEQVKSAHDGTNTVAGMDTLAIIIGHFTSRHAVITRRSTCLLCPACFLLQVSFNAAIDACGRAGQWRAALSVLDRMSLAGVSPGTITYNAVIAACGKGKEWSRATTLLEQMRAEHSYEEQVDRGMLRGPPPDVVSYGATMYACFSAAKWNEALAVLKFLQRDLIVDERIRKVPDLRSGTRASRYTFLTVEHLDRFRSAFDRCSDEDVRAQAVTLVESMRDMCDTRSRKVEEPSALLS